MTLSQATNKRRLKTHCPQGHPYDEMNTYVTSVGTRQCRICKREHGKAWGLAHPERVREWHRVPAIVIDHDHVTGRVRGAVCHNCNRGLHYLDRNGWLESAHNYLETVP